MLPRRNPPASSKVDALKERSQKKKPTLDEFLDKRDWSGALGLLQFERNSQNEEYDMETLVMWMAYCAFHLGDYKKAATVRCRKRCGGGGFGGGTLGKTEVT